ncbi:hypothetical protein J2W48_002225 [Flavobacterium piscis]|uniref:Uncharacterized protein n=1 Tax=Flavobacterium piscis TaxID=1114874 RepID=A0ABU1Y7T1_9FLAO|nr:hypothetical protein [Flavobacterium piscis]
MDKSNSWQGGMLLWVLFRTIVFRYLNRYILVGTVDTKTDFSRDDIGKLNFFIAYF